MVKHFTNMMDPMKESTTKQSTISTTIINELQGGTKQQSTNSKAASSNDIHSNNQRIPGRLQATINEPQCDSKQGGSKPQSPRRPKDGCPRCRWEAYSGSSGGLRRHHACKTWHNGEVVVDEVPWMMAYGSSSGGLSLHHNVRHVHT